MTVKSAETTYEQLTAAGLFLLVAAVGWGPFVVRAGAASYVEHGFLFVTLAIGVLSLLLVYDAAERLLGRGRGVYAGAIFCSLPATGLVAADPGNLSVAMLLLLVSAATWFAIRADAGQRRYLLAMLAGLLVIAGCGYFAFIGSLALIFPVWLATQRSSRRVLVALIMMASYGIGMLARVVSGLVLPLPLLAPAPFNALSLIATLPWRAYVVLILLALILAPRTVKSWHIGAFVTVLITTGAGAVSGANLAVLSVLLAPGLTLLASDLTVESFVPDEIKTLRWRSGLPSLLTSAAILAAMILGLSGTVGLTSPGGVRIVIGVLLAASLLFVTVRREARAAFALMFAAGVWFGSFLWPPSDQLPPGMAPVSSQAWWILVPLGMVAGITAYYLYYGRRIPKRSLPDGEFLFGGEDFRRFDLARDWGGQKAPMTEVPAEPFSFMIFGDVTGAESPVAGRHGGYFAFRNLIARMRQDSPRFAIALGDLATRASALPFRRVRQLFRRVPVPMTAIPGNHDVFSGSRYDARYFQSLFGADHRAFRIGPVQYVLINNASGAFQKPQFAWLEDVLRRSDAPFLLVFCHKPLFDPRPDASYAMEERKQAARLHDLFREHEVTAVFSGHIHALLSERRDGVTYIISGGGGSRLAGAAAVHHYLRVHVERDALVVGALPVELTPVTASLLGLHFSPRSCSLSAAVPFPSPSAS